MMILTDLLTPAELARVSEIDSYRLLFFLFFSVESQDTTMKRAKRALTAVKVQISKPPISVQGLDTHPYLLHKCAGSSRKNGKPTTFIRGERTVFSVKQRRAYKKVFKLQQNTFERRGEVNAEEAVE